MLSWSIQDNAAIVNRMASLGRTYRAPVIPELALRQTRRYEMDWQAGVGGQAAMPTFDDGQGWYELEARIVCAHLFRVADHWLVDNREAFALSPRS